MHLCASFFHQFSLSLRAFMLPLCTALCCVIQPKGSSPCLLRRVQVFLFSVSISREWSRCSRGWRDCRLVLCWYFYILYIEWIRNRTVTVCFCTSYWDTFTHRLAPLFFFFGDLCKENMNDHISHEQWSEVVDLFVRFWKFWKSAAENSPEAGASDNLTSLN